MYREAKKEVKRVVQVEKEKDIIRREAAAKEYLETDEGFGRM